MSQIGPSEGSVIRQSGGSPAVGDDDSRELTPRRANRRHGRHRARVDRTDTPTADPAPGAPGGLPTTDALTIGLVVCDGVRGEVVERVVERLSAWNIAALIMTVEGRPITTDTGRLVRPDQTLSSDVAARLTGAIVLLTDDGAEVAGGDATFGAFVHEFDARRAPVGYNEGAVPALVAARFTDFRGRDEVVWINGTFRTVDDFAEECLLHRSADDTDRAP